MANDDFAFGFRWHRRGGGNGSAAITYFDIADGTEIAQGDPVTLSSGLVVKAVTGDAILGVAAKPHPPDGIIPGPYYTGKIGVFEADKDTVFVAQADGTLAQANVGVAYDIAGASGEVEVNLAGTSNGDFVVIGKHPNDEWGANARVLGYFTTTVRG